MQVVYVGNQPRFSIHRSGGKELFKANAGEVAEVSDEFGKELLLRSDFAEHGKEDEVRARIAGPGVQPAATAKPSVMERVITEARPADQERENQLRQSGVQPAAVPHKPVISPVVKPAPKDAKAGQK